MKIILWLWVIAASILGGLIVIGGAITAKGAPQEAAAAAIGLALAVIPYCIARAVTEMGRKD